jgi:hypothetical protein
MGSVNDNEMLLNMLVDDNQQPSLRPEQLYIPPEQQHNQNQYHQRDVGAFSDSDGSDEGLSDDDTNSVSGSYASSEPEMDAITKQAIDTEKRQILLKMKRLELKKGIKMDPRFSMHSSLEDLKAEYSAICQSLGTDDAIDMMKQAIVLICTGIERFNNIYDPFSVYLDGWSASVNTTLDSKEDLLEELYDKYYSSIANTGPEFRLIFALTMSAIMYNVKNKILSPGNSSFLGKLAKDHAKGLKEQQNQEEPVDLSQINWD